MNRQVWANRLDGREYRQELSREEEEQAKLDCVLIIFGASDDLVELRGINHDEVGAYEGATLLINDKGEPLGDEFEDDDHAYVLQKYNLLGVVLARYPNKIVALWNEGDAPRRIETDLPHSAFEIMEDGEVFCRGVVIDQRDLR